MIFKNKFGQADHGKRKSTKIGLHFFFLLPKGCKILSNIVTWPDKITQKQPLSLWTSFLLSCPPAHMPHSCGPWVGLLAFTFFVLTIPSTLAQDANLSGPKQVMQDSLKAKNAYYKLYEDHLMVSPYLGLGNLIFDFRPANGDNQQAAMYGSNNNYRVGIGLSYNDIAVFVGMGTSMTNYSTEIAPQSKYQDLSLSLISGGVVTRLSYRDYQGLVETTDLSTAIAQNTKLPFRDEMAYRQYHIKSGYFFNNAKFDYNTIVNSAGQHLKSANSFNLEGGYDHYSLGVGSSLVPKSRLEPYNSSIEDLRGYEVNSFVLAPGWAGIWAGQHWYVMGKFNLGVRANLIESIYVQNRNQVMTFSPDVTVRICLGYNKPRWYLTLDTEAQTFMTTTSDYEATTTYGQIYYTVGFRFWTPRLGKLMRQVSVLRAFV